MNVLNKFKLFLKSKKFKIKVHNIKKNTKKFIINNKNYAFVFIPFILMDFFIIVLSYKISYINYLVISPVLFSLKWLILFGGLMLCFKNRIGKIIYLLLNSIFLVMFLVDNVYFSLTNTFFDFTLIKSASEGSPYMIDALKGCNAIVYFCCFIVLMSVIYGYIKFPKIKKNNYKKFGIVFLVFLFLQIVSPFTLGSANDDLTWSSWKNSRNIYNSYNDSNKSLKISGFYEYTIRNFYITFLKPQENITEEDTAFLNSSFSESMSVKNSYTGLFKGKNLIILQLEGIDKWLLNKETTPTLYGLMSKSINFNNHYSYYNGGGSTFNSEFAVNTGFITPLSYNKNAYTFNKNNFQYSLSNIFKSLGYSVNAYHMNNGEYYSRAVNYTNWGYDNYYGLIDIDEYSDQSYMLDRELILNEKMNDLLFNHEGNFVDYIITYSNHTPFTSSKGVCKMLHDMDVEEIKKTDPDYDDSTYEMSEEDCARRQASETDYMVSLLVDELKERNLYDNTVIVAFADHYLYTLNDKTILDKYKNTSNNLINNTPLFIWSKDIKKKNVKSVTSQLNILPTILNLYGISYNTNNYIGKDALAKNYKGIVFFPDYSWYDGNVYVDGGVVTNGKKISEEQLEEKNAYISDITRKNDLALKYDYFNLVKKEDD